MATELNNSGGILSLIILQNISISASQFPIITSSFILNTKSENGSTQSVRFENLQSAPVPEALLLSNKAIRKLPISDEELIASLCPGNRSSMIRYDQEGKNCSLVGYRSHCGENMIFYSYNDSIVKGQCDCDYSKSIPLVYHAQTKRCYYVYQQAYCKDNEWLELNPKDGVPKCTANKCYNSGRTVFGGSPLASRDMEPEYVPFNGTGDCVKLGQRYKKCPKPQIVLFNWPNKLYAECSAPVDDPVIIKAKTISVPSLQCAPGSYLTQVGRCQAGFDFD